MIVLGIESSCDETAAAVFSHEKGLMSNEVYSQVAIHAQYGGVVPELASRDHIRKITPIVDSAIINAGLSLADITAIAYTKGPGLIGALMVGAAYAKSLSYSLQIPAIGVHHMEAHLMAPMLETDQPSFPYIALLVSGGHTMLMAVYGFGDYKVLGESVDDAVGEAFDKSAKLLGLPYPGGPHLAKLAEQGDSTAFNFPRPMTAKNTGFDFSFSGLKTAVRNTYLASDQSDRVKADIAASFQAAAVDTLVLKCLRALEKTGFKQLVIAGGVSANKRLREQLHHRLRLLNVQLFCPRHEFCTDNAAMVAYTGYRRLHENPCDADTDLTIKVMPRWPISL